MVRRNTTWPGAAHRYARFSAAVIIIAATASFAFLVGCSSSGGAQQGSDTLASSSIDSPSTGDSAATTSGVTTDADGIEYVSDEVIVVFKDSITPQEATQALVGARSVVAQEITADELDQAVPAVTFKVADGYTVDDAIEELERLDVVASAQRNHVLHAFSS